MTLIIDLVLFACTLFFAQNDFLLTGIYILASIAILWARTVDWKIFAITVIVALVLEPLAVHFGAWGYSVQGIFGVPPWIFLMWGIGAVSVVRLSDFIRNKKYK